MNMTRPECHDLLNSLSYSTQRNHIGIHMISHYIENMITMFTNITYLDHSLTPLSIPLTRVHQQKSSSSSSLINREIYLILNYGLHLKKIHRSWAIPGMMKAILEEAKKYSHSNYSSSRVKVHILYRETSAQAFGYSKGKLFLSIFFLLSS